MRPGRPSPFPHLPPTMHTHTAPTPPPPPVALGSNPRRLGEARRGEGQRGIWPSLTETDWELRKAGVFPSHSPAAPAGLVLRLKATPSHLQDKTAARPIPSLRSLAFPAQSPRCLGCCRLSPLPGEQAPLGLHAPPPSPKQILGRVLQARWLVRGLSFHIWPSPAHASLPSAHWGPSAQILESIHNRFLIAVSLP